MHAIQDNKSIKKNLISTIYNHYQQRFKETYQKQKFNSPLINGEKRVLIELKKEKINVDGVCRHGVVGRGGGHHRAAKWRGEWEGWARA